MRRAGHFVEVRGHHGSVKRDPSKLLPQKDLQRSNVARSENYFRSGGHVAQPIEKIVRAVSPARTKDASHRRIVERLLQCTQANIRPARKKALMREQSGAVRLWDEAQSRDLFASGPEMVFLHGAGKRKDADRVALAESWRL